MALLRILLSLSIGFVLVQSFGQVPKVTPDPTTVSADQTLAAKAAQIRAKSPSNQTQLGTAAQSAPSTGQTTKVSESEAVAAVDRCEKARKAAYGVCAEWLNQDIVGFMNKHGAMLQMGMMVAGSIGEQCKGLSETMNQAGIVLGLFTVACKTAQVTCKSMCGSAKAKVGQFTIGANKSAGEAGTTEMRAHNEAESLASGLPSTAGAIAAKEAEAAKAAAARTTYLNQRTDYLAVEAHIDSTMGFCTKFEITTQNAMMGAVNALKGFAQTKACEKANKDTEVAGIDCNNSSSPGYNTPNCLCARGEKSAAECQNINVNAANINPGKITLPASASAADSAGSPTGGLGAIGAEGKSKIASTPVGGGEAAPPVDGGGAGMGGGSAGNGYGQDGAGNPNRRLNTNILGGGFGGGGGSGSAGGGPGYGEMDAKLKKYMPGGVSDPNRSIASKLAKEVTPQAGRTNWEKVRLRYRDNTSSLLNK